MNGKPTYNRKVDANQKEVLAKLRELPGVTIQDLHGVGQGCPDFVVGFLGRNYFIELKDGDKPKHQKQLTPDEEKFHKEWTGQVSVCESWQDVFKLITGQWPFNK